VASSGGGRIVVGEAAGGLEARTGGGGIRVWRVAGPSQIETAGGTIYLTGVSNRVRASTGAGGIVARFALPVAAEEPRAPQQRAAPSAPVPAPAPAPAVAAWPADSLGDFQCNGGDIVVFLPKQLGLTLDASVDGGDNFRILIDPDLDLKLRADGFSTAGPLRAAGALQGGGPLLRLRANSGNIRLRSADATPDLPTLPVAAPLPGVPEAPRTPQAPAPPYPDLDASLAHMEATITEMQHQLELRQEMLERLATTQQASVHQSQHSAEQARVAVDPMARSMAQALPQGVEYDWEQSQLTRGEDMREKLASLLTDRVIVPGNQMRPRLVHRVDPVYPEAARVRGLEGTVRLRLAVARNGSVEDVQALSGDPVLADAAVVAVRQWRYRPTVLNGKPVPVLTVLTVVFHKP
jgi:TonB family protein